MLHYMLLGRLAGSNSTARLHADYEIRPMIDTELVCTDKGTFSRSFIVLFLSAARNNWLMSSARPIEIFFLDV